MNGGWAYVAGLFDGEGSIRHSLGVHNMPRLAIYQSDRNLLVEVQGFLSSQGVTSSIVRHAPGPLSARPCYALTVNRWRSVRSCLRSMMPYLVVKRAGAQDVFRFRRMFPPLTPSQHARLIGLAGRGGPHVRWHEKRGIVKVGCSFCARDAVQWPLTSTCKR